MTRGMRPTGGRRGGFTLIELLVVISIIATLIALLASGVMKVRSRGVTAQNRWLMSQITTGSREFTSTKSVKELPYAPFNLRANYYKLPLTSPPDVDPLYAREANYLKQAFPNIDLGNTGLPADMVLSDGNAVVFFFTTGVGQEGFSNNKRQPFTPRSTTVQEELRDGPYIRGLKANMFAIDGNGVGRFVDPHGSPYAIFVPNSKENYASNPAFPFTNPKGVTTTINPFHRGGTVKKYENPKDIQIISAGEDQQFGAGGDWSAGAAPPGHNDVSNFSQSSLGAGPQ